MLGFGFLRLEVGLAWIGELGLDHWAGIGWGGFGSIDRWVWNGGSVDRWMDHLGWSSVAPMVAPVMIFGYFWRPGFQIGSIDGSVCVCVCGSVDGFVGSVRWGFFFFPSVVTLGFFFFFFNMGFCFAGILVSSGQWWLGFFWVFVLMCLCVSHRCWGRKRGRHFVLNRCWGRKRGKKRLLEKPRKAKVSVRKKIIKKG